MKKILLSAICIILMVGNKTNAQSLKAGDAVSSTASETNEVTEKIRAQIAELNQGILHGKPQFSMVGKMEKSGDSYFINGDSFKINKDTVIYGDLKPDSYVEVRGYIEQGKPRIARQITVAATGNEGNNGTKFPEATDIKDITQHAAIR